MAIYFGTTINDSPTITLEAGADIKAAQGKAVVISEGKAVLAEAGANAIGIIPLSEDEEIKKGATVSVQIKDIGAWVAGAEVKIGDELASDAEGYAVKAVEGNFIIGTALTAASEKGTIIRAQINKAGYKAAAASGASDTKEGA